MFTQIRTIAFFTLLEALRNRLIWLVLLIAAVGLGISGFLGELAITESGQIQSAVLAALLRLCAVFVLAVFVITSMVREFNDKGLELILALPLPRAAYLLGKLLGFCILAVLFAMVFGLLMTVFAPSGQAALWGASLACELAIVAALSLLCVVTFTQVISALSAVFAFYLLARSIAALQLIGHGPLQSADLSHQSLNFVINAIAILLPRLDQFTRSEWLAYHTGAIGDLAPLLGQSAIYLVLLGGAALFDLYRKNL
ncbi:MAG: ABC transporter permease [Sulfuricellaceae bacterium]